MLLSRTFPCCRVWLTDCVEKQEACWQPIPCALQAAGLAAHTSPAADQLDISQQTAAGQHSVPEGQDQPEFMGDRSRAVELCTSVCWVLDAAAGLQSTSAAEPLPATAWHTAADHTQLGQTHSQDRQQPVAASGRPDSASQSPIQAPEYLCKQGSHPGPHPTQSHGQPAVCTDTSAHHGGSCDVVWAPWATSGTILYFIA